MPAAYAVRAALLFRRIDCGIREGLVGFCSHPTGKIRKHLAMTHAETDAYRDWIGRRIQRQDVLSPRLIGQFRATLADHLAPAEVPLGAFWALCPDALPPPDLGRDGHPQPGLILPRLPLPRRMWAGGEITSIAAFHEGDVVERSSTVEAITFKTGSTGPLGFLSVRHDYTVDGALCVSERQDLVYRNDPAPGDVAPQYPQAPDKGPALASMRLTPDPVLLFRYSALTFNGHRIHYDRAYATGVEGYDDLVVHGPLQATLMFNLAAQVMGACPARFTYRGVSPLTCGLPIVVEAHDGPDGRLDLRVRREGGPVTMTATAMRARDTLG
jgi:3-methylfumaryl-CoA hydratase